MSNINSETSTGQMTVAPHEHSAGADVNARARQLISLWRTCHAIAKEIAFGSNDRARTLREALTAFLIRVASAGLLYVSQIFLARWMGGFEYGIYVFVWTLVVVLGGLCNAGFNTAIIRLAPEYRETRQFSLLHGIVSASRRLTVVVATIVMSLGLLGLWLFEPLSSLYVLPAYLALTCIPLYALGYIQDGIGRGLNWMNAALLPTYIIRPLMILVAMLLAGWIGMEQSATTAAISAIVATYVTSVLQLIWVDTNIKREIPIAEKSFDFSTWLKVSLPLLCITAAEIFLQNTDILIVSRYLSPNEVGIYFAAAKTMSLIMFVHYAVGSAVANRFSALKARGDHPELNSVIKDAVNWTFWPSLAGAGIILLLGPFLLSLFGKSFVAGYPVMIILVVGYMCRSAFGPVDFLLNMLGEQRLSAAALVFAALVNIVLNLLLVPAYGITGAATATSISLVLVTLLHYIIARKRLHIDMGIWRNLPGSISK